MARKNKRNNCFYKELDQKKLDGKPSCLAMFMILLSLVGIAIIAFSLWYFYY